MLSAVTAHRNHRHWLGFQVPQQRGLLGSPPHHPPLDMWLLWVLVTVHVAPGRGRTEQVMVVSKLLRDDVLLIAGPKRGPCCGKGASTAGVNVRSRSIGPASCMAPFSGLDTVLLECPSLACASQMPFTLEAHLSGVTGSHETPKRTEHRPVFQTSPNQKMHLRCFGKAEKSRRCSLGEGSWPAPMQPVHSGCMPGLPCWVITVASFPCRLGSCSAAWASS